MRLLGECAGIYTIDDSLLLVGRTAAAAGLWGDERTRAAGRPMVMGLERSGDSQIHTLLGRELQSAQGVPRRRGLAGKE